MSKGKAIVNLLNLEKGEEVATVLEVPSFDPGSYIIMATKNGLVKKTDLMAYSRPRVGGIIALSLVEGDELISARITDGTRNVFMASVEGKSIRFHESDVRPTGRVAQCHQRRWSQYAIATGRLARRVARGCGNPEWIWETDIH